MDEPTPYELVSEASNYDFRDDVLRAACERAGYVLVPVNESPLNACFVPGCRSHPAPKEDA